MSNHPEEMFLPMYGDKFKDPFMMQSNSFIPKDFASALDFARFL